MPLDKHLLLTDLVPRSRQRPFFDDRSDVPGWIQSRWQPSPSLSASSPDGDRTVERPPCSDVSHSVSIASVTGGQGVVVVVEFFLGCIVSVRV